MKTIAISTPYIKLDQFLKLADCVSTGGMAKALLQEEARKLTKSLRIVGDGSFIPVIL